MTPAPTHNPPLRFVHRGAVLTQHHVPPSRTLLALLREDLGLTGTKEGCAEGDCGACTVVLAHVQEGQVHYRAVNSCIHMAHAANGLALWTAADLSCDPLLNKSGAALHPAQQALVNHHGSQCGFCTPGFVMSLFGLYHNGGCQGQGVTRQGAQTALSGNLCRCTGYRPILDAAQSMATLPPASVDESQLHNLLQQAAAPAAAPRSETDTLNDNTPPYLAPNNLQALLQARAQYPQAQVVAGATDVGLWITKGQQQYPQVLDVTRTTELRRVEQQPQHTTIGAAVTLTNAFTALCAQRPQLHNFAQRFASLPVRNAGTLGGNVANGSPIGDSMPLLLALGASLVLSHWDATTSEGRASQRQVPLQDFYTGYRRNVLQPTELLTHIVVPHPIKPLTAPLATQASGEWLRVYKVSKRWEDDISAVCLAVWLQLDQGVVQQVRLGVGGMAATPVRAQQTEAALQSQAWNTHTAQQAVAVLTGEFTPLSDMRASAAYRRHVLGQLLWRCWLESQQQSAGAPTSLEQLS